MCGVGVGGCRRIFYDVGLRIFNDRFCLQEQAARDTAKEAGSGTFLGRDGRSGNRCRSSGSGSGFGYDRRGGGGARLHGLHHRLRHRGRRIVLDPLRIGRLGNGLGDLVTRCAELLL